MDEKSFYIPQYLNEPARFLLWTVDEALAFFAPVFLGLAFNHSGVGLAAGIAGIIGLKRVKSHTGQAHYKRWLYWYFPSRLAHLKNTPASAIREYVG